MNYAVTFSAKTAKYSCHAAGCSASNTNEAKGIYRCGEFQTVEAAKAWADKDESEKAGSPVKANWKRCPCAKA